MKNINVPPHATLILGVVFVIVSTFLSSISTTISDLFLFTGISLATMGTAGLAIELFGKRVRVVLSSPVSELKFSRHIAYVLSFAIFPVFIFCIDNLNFATLPVTFLFLLALAFNGGLGGRKTEDRLPFYLATAGFIAFILALLII